MIKDKKSGRRGKLSGFFSILSVKNSTNLSAKG